MHSTRTPDNKKNSLAVHRCYANRFSRNEDLGPPTDFTLLVNPLNVQPPCPWIESVGSLSTTSMRTYRTQETGLSTPTPNRDRFVFLEVRQAGLHMGQTRRGDSHFRSRVSVLVRYTIIELIRKLSSGTNLVVRGESSAVPLSTNSTVRCTIDGVEGVSEAVNSGLNIRFWQLCGSNTLREGAHQVVVNFTAGPNTIFWVDEIYYMSVASPNLRRKSSMLYPTTSEFRYTGVGWTNPFDEAGHHGRETYETGAKAIIPFYGSTFCVTHRIFRLWTHR